MASIQQTVTDSWAAVTGTAEGAWTVSITAGGDQYPVEVLIIDDVANADETTRGYYLIPPGWVRDRVLNNLGLPSVTVALQDDDEDLIVRVASGDGSPEIIATPAGVLP